MLTIVYASRATRELSADELSALLRQAYGRNTASHVTGMLLYAQRSFMQQLEGDPETVQAIYGSIVADSRHTDIRLLSRREIERRRFPDWSMGFAHPDRASLEGRLPGYRFPQEAPLVSPELVRDAPMAEALLDLYAAPVSA